MEDKMKVFNIPVIWKVYGTMEIEANSLEDAEKQALGEFPLPTESYPLDCSIGIVKNWQR